MTFCLGIAVDQGLVALADTRVVAGNECLIARKIATYQGPGFSFFTMSALAGSLFLRLFAAFALFAFAGDIVADSLSDACADHCVFAEFTIGLES